jgi:rhodanese-related sulfurtransferase
MSSTVKEMIMSQDITMCVSELRKRMDAGEQFTYLDSRNPQAWQESDVKLPGAIRVLGSELESHVDQIPKGRALITYCT